MEWKPIWPISTGEPDEDAHQHVDEKSPPPIQELRIAASFSGGISLAIWMGGLTFELDRMLRSSDAVRARYRLEASAEERGMQPASGHYAWLLDFLRIDADVDVITGTSAGGINGAALGLARVSGATLEPLPDIWMDKGSFSVLLRKIDDPAPASLLQGDDVLHAGLLEGLHRIEEGANTTGRRTAVTETSVNVGESRANRLRLIVTSTLMKPAVVTIRDSLDTAVFGEDNQYLFEFEQPPGTTRAPGDFDPVTLARASRSSASYPVAFEPSGVPSPTSPGVRWMIDGGLRNNQPVGTAFREIWGQPAGAPARRVLLHVVPDPGSATQADNPSDPPAVFDALGATVAAGFSQSWTSDLKEARRRSDAARRLQGSVTAMSQLLGDDDVEPLLHRVWDMRREWVVEEFLVALEAQRSRNLAVAPGPSSAISSEVGAERRSCQQRADEHWPPGLRDPLESLPRLGPDLFNFTFQAALARIRAVPGLEPGVAAELHATRRAGTTTRWERDHLRTFLTDEAGPGCDVTAADDLFGEWLSGAFPDNPTSSGQDRICHLAESWGALQSWSDNYAEVLAGLGADQVAVWKALVSKGAVGLLLSGDTRDNQEVELVQMSGYTRTRLTPQRFETPSDKLTGVALSHFGAFLSRACRANDWMWGRLDGAGWMLQLLLTPTRLRAIADTRYGGDTDLLVAEMLEEVRGLSSIPPDPELLTELEALNDPDLPIRALPSLTMLLAEGLQKEIAAEELARVAQQMVKREQGGGQPVLSPADSAFRDAVRTATQSSPSGRIEPHHVTTILESYEIPRVGLAAILAQPELRRTAGDTVAVAAAAIDYSAPDSGALRQVTGNLKWVGRAAAQAIRGDRSTQAALLAAAIGVLLLIIGGPAATSVGLPLVVAGIALAIGRSGRQLHKVFLAAGCLVGLLAGLIVAFAAPVQDKVTTWIAEDPWSDALIVIGLAIVGGLLGWALGLAARWLAASIEKLGHHSTQRVD